MGPGINKDLKAASGGKKNAFEPISQLTQAASNRGKMLAVAGVGSVSCCERAVAAVTHRAEQCVSSHCKRMSCRHSVTMVFPAVGRDGKDRPSNSNY